MTFPFADLVSPAPPSPAVAGLSAPSSAPAQGESGGFADALAAVQAGTAKTESGEVVAPGSAIPPRIVEGLPPGLILPGIEQDPALAGEVAAILPVSGTGLSEEEADPANGDTVVAPVPVDGDTDAAPEDDAAAPDTLGVNAGLVVAVAAPVTAPVAAAPEGEGTDPLAGALPASSPVPPVPELPLDPAIPDDAPLMEGRSAAAGPPPSLVPPASNEVPEAPVLTQQQLDAAAPRAVAPTAPTIAEQAPPVSVPVAPAPAATETVPEAVRDIAANPHVTSVQAKAAAPAAETADGATTETPDAPAPATATPTTPVAADTAPVVVAKPVDIPEPDDNLTADVRTEAKAADAALDVLTKDKTEAKPQTAQPQASAQTTQTAQNAAPADEAAPAEPEKAAATEDAPVKTAEAKPEAEPDKAKPAAPEKPQHDNRLAQQPQPLAVTDKPVVQDAVAKAHQQMQTLPAAVIPHIAGEIASRTKQGSTQFEIRLDPPELGRVDVRIEVDSDGRVMSRLTVEKSETLDLLKADQRALERALQDAGFKSDQNSLSFSLRDERGNGHTKFEDQRLMHQQGAPKETEEEPARLAAGIAYRAALRGPGGLDLTV